VRHAETIWNRTKRIQGHSDSPLSSHGRRQAARWAALLREMAWDRIIASDTGRALATAQIINTALQVPLSCDARLREQDWGRWTGKTVPQLEAEQPQALAEQIGAGWKFRPPGGESRCDVWARSHAALALAADKWPGETIMVVTHEGVIKSLIYHLSGRRYLPDEPPLLKSYYLHWLAVDEHRLQLGEINALALETARIKR